MGESSPLVDDGDVLSRGLLGAVAAPYEERPGLLPGVEIKPAEPEQLRQEIYVDKDEQLIIPTYALPDQRQEV